MDDYVKVPRAMIEDIQKGMAAPYGLVENTVYLAACRLLEAVEESGEVSSMTTGHSEPGSRWEGIPDRSLSFSDSPLQWVLLTEEEADRLVLVTDPDIVFSIDPATDDSDGVWCVMHKAEDGTITVLGTGKLPTDEEPCPCKGECRWEGGWWHFYEAGEPTKGYAPGSSCPWGCGAKVAGPPSWGMDAEECRVWLDEQGWRASGQDVNVNWWATLTVGDERNGDDLCVAEVDGYTSEIAALRALVDAVRSGEDYT